MGTINDRFSAVHRGFVVMIVALAGAPAFAATGTWTGVGATWDTTATNWNTVTGTPWDLTNGGTNTAVFNTASATPSVSGTVWVKAITFNQAATLSNGTITLAGATPTITGSANATIGSTLAGSVGLMKAGTSTLTLTGSNTYSGTTGVTAGGLTLGGPAGSILGSSAVNVTAATLTLDNATNNLNDRIADTATVTLNAVSTLAFTGNGATASTTEGLGTLSLGGGQSTITLGGAGTGQLQTLSATSFSRSAGAVALVRGTNLQTAATNSTRLTVGGAAGTGLSFVGAGTSSVGTSTAGTDTTLRIVPYLVGDTSTSGSGSTFLTYDTNATAFGLRPLASGEYTTLTAGYTTAATAENVNAFNGTITTSSGVTVNSLRFNAAGALNGSGGGLTVNSGAILATASGTIGSGFSGLTLGNGTWNEGVVTPTSGTLTINAPITVTGNGGLTKGGAGTLVLGSSNSIAGGVTVQQGAIQVNNANALGSGALTFNVDADTTTVFNLAASGTIANNMTFNKPASARNFFFQQNQNNNLTLAGSINQTGANASKFQLLSGVSTGTFTLTGSNTFGSQVQTGAGVTIRISGTAASGTNIWRPDQSMNLVLLDGAAFTAQIGNSIAVIAMETSGTASLTATLNTRNTVVTTINTPAGAQLSFAGRISNESGFTAGTFSKTGAGTWVVSNSSNAAAPYNVLGGVLQVPVFTALGGSSGASYLVLNGGTLQYAGSGTSTDKQFTLGASGGGLDASGSGTVAFTSGSAVAFTGSGNRTLTLTGTNTGNNVLAATITDNGADVVSLAKTGAGRWALSGSNSFTGGVTVSAGQLNINNLNALGGGGGNLGVSGGTLDLGSYSIARSGTVSITGGTIQSGTLTNDTVAYDAQAGTVSATLAGAAGLTKSTSGTVTLSGSNSYSGGTQINAGVLALGNAGALGATGTISFGGGTLQFSGSNTTDYSNRFSTANNQAFSFDTNGRNVSLGAALTSSGGSLTKLGSGTLTLSGSNGFSGAATISAGVISFGDRNAFSQASGIVIAGGAGLLYTGTAATFAKNITVMAGSGTGTVTNSGGGLLTLSGTLSKDNSVLRLTGGSFNVTGLITGATPGASDLIVDGTSSVTLSNTNTYNGPTYVYNSGTLSLGVDNAIPNTSRVELGNATTRGTLVLGTYSDSISQLLFSGSGGILSLSGDKTAAVQLTTAGSLSLGSNASLALTSPGTTLGLYRLISYTSLTGSFASVNVSGLPTNYTLLYTGTEIDMQRKAEQAATLAYTLPTSGTLNAFTNTNVSFSGTLSNLTPTGGAALAVSLSGNGGNLSVSGLAAVSGSTVNANSSSTVTGTIATGATLGARTWSVVNTDTSAITSTTSTANGTINVFAHGTPTLSTQSINFGRVLAGATSSQTVTVSNGTLNSPAANTAGITWTAGSTPSGFGTGGSNQAGVVASGSAVTYTYTLATGSAAAYSGSQTFSFSDDSSILGSGALNSIAVNLSGTVVNQRIFTTSTSALAFGNVHQGKALSSTVIVTSTGLNDSTANASLGAFSGGPSGFSLATGNSTSFNGGSASQSATYSFSGTAASLGSLAGTFSSAVSGEFAGIPNIDVAVTGNVYSGQATWATNGGGNWGTLASGFGSNWGTNQGSPGLDSGYTNTDTSTFGSVVTGGTATIALAGAAPSLKAITFNNSSGSYLVAGGAITLSSNSGTASLSVLSGSHEIASNLSLGSLTSVNTLSGAILTLSGSISGSGGFVKIGDGTLNLMAANSYTGNTAINAGTLKIFNVSTFGTGTVTLASGATLDLDNLSIANALVNNGGTMINSGSYAGNQTVTGSATFAGSTAGSITLDPGASATITGNVTSAASLAVSASSTLIAAQGSSFAAGSMITNAGQFIVSGSSSIASNINGNGSFVVNGGGLVQLTGSSGGFTGLTEVSGANTHLSVNSVLGSSIAIDAGAILGGSGSIAGVLSGAGLVSPGNSPGILTAGQFDPTGGLGTAFEFKASAPNYASPTGSLNDVLRLTNVTSPFVSNLTSGNNIDVYFNVGSIAMGDVFEGGFFTGLSDAALLASVQNAHYTYWVANSGGATLFNGVHYSSLTSLPGITGVTVNTVARTTDFGGGSVTGSVTQFVIVPEPGSLALAGLGIGLAGWSLWKRRRIAHILRK